MPGKKTKTNQRKPTVKSPKLEKPKKERAPKVKHEKPTLKKPEAPKLPKHEHAAAAKSIKSGSQVRIDYTGKLESGEVFDTSVGKNPLVFVLGTGQIIPGLEKGLVGMKKGDKKTIPVMPEEAYGHPNPKLVQELPKGPLPPNMELKVGMVLLIRTPDGHPMPVKVKEIKENTVVLDFNHPLAGKKLFFEVDVLEVA